MPTNLSPVDVANIALSKIGSQAINSLTDLTSQAAIICNTNFNLAYLEVSRAGQWNCLLDTAILVQEVQVPLPGAVTPSPTPSWAPNTTYLVNTFLSYGSPQYIYEVVYTYTSSTNFQNDLTTGALVQTNLPVAGDPFVPGDGSQYPSGWAFKYALPTDFQLLAVLNDNVYWDVYGSGGDDYQIMGLSLFCNWSQAVIQYVKNEPDCTKWDSLFTNAVTMKLASTIATPLRQDGGRTEVAMLQGYEDALKKARVKNAGERQPRRFNPINSSRFNAARYTGING